MNSLSFENRVSLARKSEDLIRTIKGLSACYTKREEFVSKIPYLQQTICTSEICPPIVCVFVMAAGLSWVVVAVGAAAVETVVYCHSEWIGCDGETAMVDFSMYKNIV